MKWSDKGTGNHVGEDVHKEFEVHKEMKQVRYKNTAVSRNKADVSQVDN